MTFLTKSIIYENFAGTQRYCLAGFTTDENDESKRYAILALLEPPGGTIKMDREEFERDFAPAKAPNPLRIVYTSQQPQEQAA